jgi:hypothetical protein
MANVRVNSVVLVQGRTEDTPFSIGGVDESNTNRTMQIVIKEPPRYGDLYANERILEEGSVIQVPEGESRVLVSYQSTNEFYFTLPSSSSSNAIPYAGDKFEFMIESIHPVTGEPLNSNYTRPVTQRIEVLNVNHRPSLILPVPFVTLTPPLPHLSPSAVFEGIKVEDADNDVNDIRVTIGAENGVLTINEKDRSLADFASCNERYESEWRCQGDGVSDRKMTFLTKPSNLEAILSGLKYTSYFQNMDDKLTVQVFDGIGGDCISQEEQAFSVGPNLTSYSSVQDGCYGITASVDILYSREQAGESGGGGMDSGSKIRDIFSAQSILGWLFYGLLIFCFCSGSCVCFRCFFRRKRSNAVSYE